MQLLPQTECATLASIFVRRFSNRRVVFASWLVLSVAQIILVTQNWYQVTYAFDGTTKSLAVSGVTAWPLINGAALFNLVALAAVALSRGYLRRALTWLVLVIGAGMAVTNLGEIKTTVPPAVNAAVEKVSGVVGGATSNNSDAISSISSHWNLLFSYCITVVLILVLELGAALYAGTWTKTEGRDKYQRGAAATPETAKTAAASKAKNAKTGKPSKGKKSKSGKSDNISLWDSQR